MSFGPRATDPTPAAEAIMEELFSRRRPVLAARQLAAARAGRPRHRPLDQRNRYLDEKGQHR
jgi:hypothetical protein